MRSPYRTSSVNLKPDLLLHGAAGRGDRRQAHQLVEHPRLVPDREEHLEDGLLEVVVVHVGHDVVLGGLGRVLQQVEQHRDKRAVGRVDLQALYDAGAGPDGQVPQALRGRRGAIVQVAGEDPAQRPFDGLGRRFVEVGPHQDALRDDDGHGVVQPGQDRLGLVGVLLNVLEVSARGLGELHAAPELLDREPERLARQLVRPRDRLQARTAVGVLLQERHGRRGQGRGILGERSDRAQHPHPQVPGRGGRRKPTQGLVGVRAAVEPGPRVRVGAEHGGGERVGQAVEHRHDVVRGELALGQAVDHPGGTTERVALRADLQGRQGRPGTIRVARGRVLDHHRPPLTEVAHPRHVAVERQRAEDLDERVQQGRTVLGGADLGEHALTFGRHRQQRRVQEPVDRQVRVVPQQRQLGLERGLDGGTRGPALLVVAAGGGGQVARGLHGPALVHERPREQPHQPLAALRELGAAGAAAVVAVHVGLAEGAADLPLPALLRVVRDLLPEVQPVLEGVEHELHVAGLVVLPPHPAAAAQIQQGVVVPLVVEDHEAREGLVDPAEVAVVVLQVRLDEVPALAGPVVDEAVADLVGDPEGHVQAEESAGGRV
jgi:hypothetical protein